MTAAPIPAPTTTWTDAQARVTGLSASKRTLVVADAGTGKTAVLIARIDYLVRHEGAAPGSEVLTVSFTRSTVSEIKDRLRRNGGPARYATVATFDSLATRFLTQHDPEGDWAEGGYDARIKAAIRLIRESDSAREELGSLQHFLVDEIQDLVGVRLEFVETILATLRSGFTLFGDPAQAIYDWQAGERPGARIFDSVRADHQNLVEVRFTRNFRAETEETAAVVAVGALLNERDPDYRTAAQELLNQAEHLPRFTGVEQLATALRIAGEPVAVLTRTNGEALIISDDLWGREVEHQLRRGSADRAVAPWVGRVVSGSTSALMSPASFTSRASSLAQIFDADEALASLQRLTPSRSGSLDVDLIRRRIAIGHMPDELCAQSPRRITVSTVHRAKGLEYDAVVIIRPDPDEFLRADDLEGETRTLYVAMTRPKRSIMTLPSRKTWRLAFDKRTARWYLRGREKWQTMGFEVQGDDVHRANPAGSYLLEGDVAELQEYLWECVKPGDPIDLALLQSGGTDEVTARYAVIHKGRAVGVTSEQFGTTLHRRLHGKGNGRWPLGIVGLRMDSCDTVAGTRAASENAGLGASGIWIRPRIVGLGRFTW